MMNRKILMYGAACIVATGIAFGSMKNISKANDVVDYNNTVMVEESMNIQETQEMLLEKGYSYNDMESIVIVEAIEDLKENNKTDDEILKILNDKVENNNGRVTRGNPLYQIPTAFGVWRELSEDEKKLIIGHPNKALVGLSASNKATEYTIREFGINGLGDRSDAFRHTIWCALMSRDAGAKFAKDFSTAHESGKTEEFLQEFAPDGYREYEHREMDLHNNSIGVHLGDKFIGSDEELINRVKEVMTNDESTGVYWLHN